MFAIGSEDGLVRIFGRKKNLLKGNNQRSKNSKKIFKVLRVLLISVSTIFVQ